METIADDFVAHSATRWESGKSMLVCIDRVTCGRMFNLIAPRWRAKRDAVQTAIAAQADTDKRERVVAQARWMDETIIEIVISEAQNEVADFKRWGFDILPHRERMKRGFETPDGRRIDIESAFEDIRALVEKKLQQMLQRNPRRMDYYRRYQEIVADYNGEKDRVTIEETFARLVELAHRLDVEQSRAAREGLSEDELALFDLLKKDSLGKAERERLKLASKDLLAKRHARLAGMERWTEKEQTQADVEVFILDNV